MDDRIDILERRGRRLRGRGEFRKAANAYGELTSIEPENARYWVLMGSMLRLARREEEAGKALRQAAYLFRRQSRLGCVESVQRLLDGISAVPAAA